MTHKLTSSSKFKGWLSVASFLVIAIILQITVTMLVFAPIDRIQFYWRPYWEFIITTSAITPIITTILAVIGLIFAVGLGTRLIMTITLLSISIAIIASVTGIVTWYALFLGTGSGETVSAVANAQNFYRLDYLQSGDPPTSYYEFLECDLTGYFCKSLGLFYTAGLGKYEPVRSTNLKIKNDSITIELEGAPIAQYANSRLSCLAVECINQTDK